MCSLTILNRGSELNCMLVKASCLEGIVQQPIKFHNVMTSSEDSDSDWKDYRKERGCSGPYTSTPIFLENSCNPKKPMKLHDRGKCPSVSTIQSEDVHTSGQDLSLNSVKGSFISSKKLSLHHNLTSEADHPHEVDNILYITFNTKKKESHANGNSQTEILKMIDENATATEQTENGTDDHGDDTSNNDWRGDPEGESTNENMLRPELDESDDGYVTVRSRISVNSAASKKSFSEIFSPNQSGLALEPVYTNVPKRAGLVPQPRRSGDMATEKADLEKDGDYCKLLPLGTSEEMKPSEMFYSYTVRQVYDCFISCGLEQMADTCKARKLDGAFFKHLMNDNFSELLSKDPFNLTLLDTFKVKTIIRGWRPNVSIKKPQS
ncbi:hypothetical protein ACJMK2_040771 [Sinanodonta woodiana]|uniref:Uncharacterized protein n=1 Tax=Sinanodonta woodiana TaxID=1069815 RepID=A0ABD3W238_SINWO